MYKVIITKLAAKHVKSLEDAFKDRDIIIDTSPSLSEEPGLSDVTISNVHPITLTPLMWWILHNIDKSDYNQIIIS